MQGKHVDLILDRQRFQCRECKATLYEDVPGLAEGHRMTERLFDEICRRAAPETFAKVAADYGVSEKTVRNAFGKRTDKLVASYHFETPRVLGIDEKHLGNSYRTVIGNVADKTLLDLLADRKSKTLDAYFAAMPDKDKVEVWCQDMWPTYRAIAQKHFPNAQIVIDRFHVVSLATVAMEAIRKRMNNSLPKGERLALKKGRSLLMGRMPAPGSPERMTLDEWFAKWPLLGDAFEAKEGIVSLYTSKDAASARAWYQAWREQLPVALHRDFARVITAFANWGTEIFAYFEHPYTSGYIEGLNSLIGTLQRNGRGYTFEVLRSKALLTYGTHKVSKPKFKRAPRPRGGITANFEMAWGFELRLPDRNLGVDLARVTAALSTPEAFAQP
jgi:transposase